MATERKEKIILTVVALVLIVSIALLAIIRINSNKPLDHDFTPPRFESAVMKGIPTNVSENYDSIELPTKSGKCTVAMEVIPKVIGDKLHVFVTSFVDNVAWIRIVLYDQDRIVGETGIIRPGEYVEAVTLHKEVKSGDQLTVKLLTYEPDTYYSLGTASANILVR